MIKSHRYYKQKLNDLDNVNKPFRAESDEPLVLDTVGAVCLDWEGDFASAVSSGGILLKHPGRVGHAAMFGCGCWVQEAATNSETNSIAVCTTGCGEYVAILSKFTLNQI